MLNLSIKETREKLKAREFSAIELTKTYLEQIEKQKHLNAYVTVVSDIALQKAIESDTRYKDGSPRMLEGIPVGIKDLFCTRNVRTTSCSKILENFVPQYESTVTQNLWNHGAIMLGKLNMDEFAMGSTNSNSIFGPSFNPWQYNAESPLVPGGSSGGSAAAVAGKMALAATASDTGGSIRQPASFCGVVGIKPTYGLCSRWGMIAYASSLDQAGPIARNVEDCALVLKAMAGFDSKDARSIDCEIPNYLDFLGKDIKGMRIGIVEEYLETLRPDMQRLIKQAMSWFEELGAEVVPIHIHHAKYALPVYYVIAPAEASSNLARFDGIRYGFREAAGDVLSMNEKTRQKGFGDEVKRRILIGTYVLSAGQYDAFYNKAQKVRKVISNEYQEAFSKVDLVISPTTPTAAFPLNDKPKDPVTMYLNDIFTVTVNLAGLPAISLPIGLSDEGLPLGLQIIGPKLSEAKIFQAAYLIEQLAKFQGDCNNAL